MQKNHRNAIQPGQLLHWYRIKGILGQGGFGITYLAHDMNLDEEVAIKEYLPLELAVREGDCSVNPLSEDHGERYHRGLEKFIEEARTLSRFRHPNIVRVRSVFEKNNTAYMVMEYEEGETLKDLLTRRKTLDEAELLNLLTPILGGLEHVHHAGFVHRDIKPANIFIRKDGSPVLLDFGSARNALQGAARTLTSLVSPGYAPVEQYYSKSDAQGPWSDIYGLGATLYRAISGRAPMDALDRSEAILKTSRDAFISALELGSGRYSARFLRSVDHALQFRSEQRPQSIADWRGELCTAAPMTQASVEPTTLRLDTTAIGPATVADIAVPKRDRTRNAWKLVAALMLLLNLGLAVHLLQQGVPQDGSTRITIVVEGGRNAQQTADELLAHIEQRAPTGRMTPALSDGSF